MATVKQQYLKYSLIVLIIVLGVLLFKEFTPFLGAFLGAFTIYMLVRKQMHRLVEHRGWNKIVASMVIMLEVILIFLLPALMGVTLIVKVVENVAQNIGDVESSFQAALDFFEDKMEIDLLSQEGLVRMSSYITTVAKTVVGEISTFLINAFFLLFILYFMLLSSRELEQYLYDLMPFDEKNKREVAGRIRELVLSNAIGIPLLAIAQGIIATIGYMIFDVPLPLVFGMLTCFATIIPLVGTGFIWFPLVVYLLVTQDWGNAIGLALYALIIITNVDNLLRFLLQKQMADVHPLITVFGVIIGLSVFGFWGVIFGPVILSLFLMLVDMFKKEYLDKSTLDNVVLKETETEE